MTYRSDIDGLRAIAVGAVVLFHAGVPGFSGGFVGVDVFFVISGFLITSIVLKDCDANRFSILDFYERRIRRIFPALFAMVAVVTSIAAWVVLPEGFLEYGWTLLTATLFSSNFYFWRGAGYFAPDAEFNLLLHTWSLSVEEQFYIFHPIAIAFIVRFAKARLATILAIGCIGGFALSFWMTSAMPAAAFYLFPSRAWELLAGAWLATGRAPRISRAATEALAALGLGAIVWSVVFFSEATAFPGAAAALPCLGTVALVYTGGLGKTRVSALLSLRPIVFIGLISYSLYLWHWPALALAKHALATPVLPAEVAALAVLVSFLLSVVSWRYVERPFRDRARFGKAAVYRFGIAMLLVSVAVSGAIVVRAGLPGRFDPVVVDLEQAKNDFEPRSQSCLALGRSKVEERRFCGLGALEQPVEFLFWGDSHAGSLIPAVSEAALEADRHGVFAGRSACPPLVEVSRAHDARSYPCLEFNRDLLKILEGEPTLKTVVLAARWSISSEGTRYKQERGEGVALVDHQSPASESGTNHAVFRAGLRRTLELLRASGREVVVIGPIPEIGHDVPLVLATARRFGRASGIEPSIEEFESRQQFVLSALREETARTGARLVLPHDVLCSREQGGVCRVEANERAFYIDDNHLSSAAMPELTRLFEAIFTPR